MSKYTGDLVYLTKRIDESWLYGMCGGVDGMFPTGYVNVVVALPEEEEEKGHGEEQGHGQVPPTESYHPVSSTENPVSSRDSSSDCKQHLATALYQFQAETENDLSLEVSCDQENRTFLVKFHLKSWILMFELEN